MTVSLQTIGELCLRIDGAPVSLPRSKAVRALLVYVALAPRPVHRDKLCELFFSRTADPRASLRWALSKVRAALGGASAVLLADRDTVHVDHDSLEVDILTLRRWSHENSTVSSGDLTQTALGEPALADIRLDSSPEFEAWRIAAAGEAIQVQKKVLNLVLASSDLAPDVQIELSAKLAALDPSDPQGHAAQCACLQRHGRSREARQIFDNARRLLTEYGSDDQLVAAWRRQGADLETEKAGETITNSDSQVQLTADILSRPAIAVPPFQDLNPTDENEHLADSLALEIIAGLSAWRLLPVISHNSTQRFKNASGTASEVGQAVGARYVLAGSLRRAGSRIRLSVELVDARHNQQLWSNRFDCHMDDIFEVEDELVARVVQSVMPQIETAERQRLLRKRPEDYDAWDLAMRAHWLANMGGADAYDEAIVLARKAARLDPGFGLPHVIIAFVRFQQAMKGWSLRADLPFREVFRATLDAAGEALQIDPGSWMAHALTGVGELWTNRRHEKAAEHLDRAIKLNPSGSWSYHFGGCIQGFCGRLDDARFNQEQLFRLDPVYPYTAVVEADLALWNMLDGNLDAAETHIGRSQDADPDYVRGVQRLVVLHGLKGDKSAAEPAVQRLAKLSPPLDHTYLAASYPFKNPEHSKIFSEGLRRAGVNIAET